MRFRYLAAPVAAAAITLACVPQAPAPTIGQPGYCGQTADGKAVVALTVSGNCHGGPGQATLMVDENCGPLVQGSNAVDDCYRGNGPGGPGYYRLGTLSVAPYSWNRLVATDAQYLG